MQPLLIALGSFVLYIVAYNTYGRWLGRRIFRLNADAVPPSRQLEDGSDYVPTSRGVVFGHHFTSIAGTGPIVGPALAVLWGWVPALLWVLFGSIFIGAVHDLGSLVISLRNRGQTVGDIAGRVIHPRVRILFLTLLFFALTIVLAIFGIVIAGVFKRFPSSIFPCLVQIPIAMIIGSLLHRRGAKLLLPSIIALMTMYLTVWFGDSGWLKSFNATLANWPLIVWVAVLLAYSYAASVMPVWLLLQPRDYINSLQLLSALGLIVAGLVAAAFVGGPALTDGSHVPLSIIAPAVASNSTAALPHIFPFLFITIACGAISGFHCLVSSGTTSKQLRCETDAQLVGYGSMLTEGFLAVVVIIACVAGLSLGVQGTDGNILTGAAAWESRYGSWQAASAGALGAFVQGAGNFLRALGIPTGPATALVGVLVASFAATTLDTACRLQRYVVQELAATIVRHDPVVAPHTGIVITGNPLTWLCHRHGASLFAITTAMMLAALPPQGATWTLATAGSGGLILWPLFGATNQLLGGLAFLVILFWMARRNLPLWFIAPPTLFMLILPAWALLYQVFFAALGSDKSWIAQGNWALAAVGIGTLVLEVWMIIESIRAWPSIRGHLEAQLPPLPSPSSSSSSFSTGS